MTKVRQTAPTIDQIRDDHVARYKFAGIFAEQMELKTCVDVGCGVGYGAKLLTQYGLHVLAFDRDAETIDYAKKHYADKAIRFEQFDLRLLAGASGGRVPMDLVTAFEVIEHTPAALPFLGQSQATYLIGSVPNQDVVPFNPLIHNKEHYKHFTPEDIRESLADVGWKIIDMGSQLTKRGRNAAPTFDTTEGRTLVFVAMKETLQ